jgi:hypothetical protein
MSRLDRNNELYNRYVKKFSEQEDQIENSRASIKDLDGQVNEQQKQLDEYMLSLDLS